MTKTKLRCNTAQEISTGRQTQENFQKFLGTIRWVQLKESETAWGKAATANYSTSFMGGAEGNDGQSGSNLHPKAEGEKGGDYPVQPKPTTSWDLDTGATPPFFLCSSNVATPPA